MATVRQSLALQDRMSPVLSKIVKALHSTLDIMEQVDAASDRGIGAGAFAKARKDIESANTALIAARNNIDDIAHPVNNATSGFSRWQSIIVTANQGLQLTQSLVSGINKATGFFDGIMGIGSRLNLVTDELSTQAALQDKIFESAQRSRASYLETASTVAKLNLLAKDTFGSNDEAIAFAETMSKAFVLSGAGTSERNAAMYQMTQALGSGKLQGDEFRSIQENAPMVAKAIEDYMRDVEGAKGSMKDWSSDGLLTAEVIKAAVFNASEEINAQFEEMPKKFGDHMTDLKNEAIKSLEPITARFESLMQSEKFAAFMEKGSVLLGKLIGWLDRVIGKIEQIGNNKGFQQFASEVGNALSIIVIILGGIVDLTLWLIDITMSAWPIIGPIVWGVVGALIAYKTVTTLIAAAELAKNAIFLVGLAISAAKAGVTLAEAAATMTDAEAKKYATAQQWALNSAMYAFPGMWIILIIIGIIVAIYAIVGAINMVTGESISATGIILGALAVAGAFIWDLFLGILDLVLMIINEMVNRFVTFVNFFANVFRDPIGSVIHLFGSLADRVLGILESIAKAMDKVFGSSMADSVAGWRKGLDSKINMAAEKYGNGAYEEVMGNINLSSESLGLKRIEYSDAWKAGYSAGESVDASVGGVMDDLFGGMDFSAPEIGQPTDEQFGGFDPSDYDTGNGIKVDASGSEVSLSDEDIKFLRDVAKLEYVNQYTTLRPVVQASFGDVHETADVNQVIKVFEDALEAAYDSSLNGG